MKNLKHTFCATLLAFSLLAHAQTQFDSIPIAPCFCNSGRTIMDIENTVIFNQARINLNRYNWKNPTINCHINSATGDYKKFVWNRYGGYTALGMGAGTLYGGYITYQTSQGPLGLTELKGKGVRYMVIGTAITTLGIYLIKKGIQRRKKANQHVHVVGEYYRNNNLY